MAVMVIASMTTAGANTAGSTRDQASEVADSTKAESGWQKAFSRLTVGGYGEAVGTYNFYSDNVYRYQFPDSYRDSKGHARFDLPHVVLMLGYDFGKGWTMGAEIEFEHGGVEAAVEMENEEAGEFEREIERGGEVALEQFWIQKEFMPQLNLRMGHIVVPVGATNNKHLPTEFFTAYRPEGENTIFPCTWHETGISLWGRAGDWRDEGQLVTEIRGTAVARTQLSVLQQFGVDTRRFGISLRVQAGQSSGRGFQGGQLLCEGASSEFERLCRKQLQQ